MRTLLLWLTILGVGAALCVFAYQTGWDQAGGANAQETEKLRAEREVFRVRHDAAVEGLAQAERQLRLSQQAFTELSAALDVSREQIARMRAELDVLRQTLTEQARSPVARRPQADR